jgi:hypothetical protein
MNTETNIRGAMKTARFARRSWKGSNSVKGYGKKHARKADRRVSRALCQEVVWT